MYTATTRSRIQEKDHSFNVYACVSLCMYVHIHAKAHEGSPSIQVVGRKVQETLKNNTGCFAVALGCLPELEDTTNVTCQT